MARSSAYAGQASCGRDRAAGTGYRLALADYAATDPVTTRIEALMTALAEHAAAGERVHEAAGGRVAEAERLAAAAATARGGLKLSGITPSGRPAAANSFSP